MATTKLDIAQGKARKNSAVATKHTAAGAEGDTRKASAAYRDAPASRHSKDATGGRGNASAASTCAKHATTRSTASKGNTTSASSSSAKGITSLSPAAGEGAIRPLCTASSTTTHSTVCEQYRVGNQGV